MAIADGFSRVTNGKRIGVFSMQQGPGSENAFPGAAQAFSDNTPILLLPGGEYKSKAFIAPNFSPYDNYAHVTKWRAQINMVERIPELMRRAFYQLRTGKGGPVLLESTPRDIWTDELKGKTGLQAGLRKQDGAAARWDSGSGGGPSGGETPCQYTLGRVASTPRHGMSFRRLPSCSRPPSRPPCRVRAPSPKTTRSPSARPRSPTRRAPGTSSRGPISSWPLERVSPGRLTARRSRPARRSSTRRWMPVTSTRTISATTRF